jgi:hypothetical protein
VIKIERPPNFEQILAKFPSADKPGVIFAYGEDIYNPSGKPIPHFILAHEYRHCARQWQADPEAWWEKYLTDDEFRYGEELIAHVEEYLAQARVTKDRNERARLEMRTAARLIAPLYGYTPPRSLNQAVRDIHLLAH